MSNANIGPVSQFFNAFSRGDVAGILETLHDEVTIIAAGPDAVPWYGTYSGKAGAQAFLSALGGNVEPQQFDIHLMIAQEETVVVTGYLSHRIPATGKQFTSDWALLCTIEDDRIKRYQFFENTAAAVEAFRTLEAFA